MLVCAFISQACIIQYKAPTCIDDIWIHLIELGEGAEANDAVLALQADVDVLGDEIAGEHWQSDPQIHKHAVLSRCHGSSELEGW